MVVASARSALLELLLTACRIVQFLDGAKAMPRLGPLDIVVLQKNNRVWAADVACNVVSQVFQRAWCWAMGKTSPVFRCLLDCWAPEKFWYRAAGAALLGCHGSCFLLRLEPSLPGPVLYPWVWWPSSGWDHTVPACHLPRVALAGTRVVAPLGKFLPVQLGDIRQNWLSFVPRGFYLVLYVYFQERKYGYTLFTLHQYWEKPQKWSCHKEQTPNLLKIIPAVLLFLHNIVV